jgi:hypothetical protein
LAIFAISFRPIFAAAAFHYAANQPPRRWRCDCISLHALPLLSRFHADSRFRHIIFAELMLNIFAINIDS